MVTYIVHFTAKKGLVSNVSFKANKNSSEQMIEHLAKRAIFKEVGMCELVEYVIK